MVELPVFRLADIIGHLTRFNTNGEYNFLLNDPTPRYYLPIHSDPTDEDTDDDGLNDDVDPEPLVVNTPPFGTDEYFEEVDQKAAKSLGGTYNHSWYADLGGLLPLYLDIQREKDVIAKAKLDIMMKDVNRYEKYLYTVSDQKWLRFCKYFNECVREYGTVDEELHYFRLKLNRAPETLEEMISLINSTSNVDDKWIMCSPKKGRYHMFGEYGAYNIKFISSNNTDNIYEAVYDKDGKIITENDNYGKNMGTYNYASSSKHAKKHSDFDVETYEKMKNTYQDYLHQNTEDNPDDNIIYDKYPRDKHNPSEIDSYAQEHYTTICKKIGISYDSLIEMYYSDKCY